mgnify:CR=1 FL=1
MTFLTTPIIQLLVFLYDNLNQNLGLAIIALTFIIRLAVAPITIPSLRSAKKMQDLKPHLDKLKKKHKDKTKLQQAQLSLYREHGVNPLGGCLPQIAQLIILIALYQAFISFISRGSVHDTQINMRFLWLDLSKPDPKYILPVLAGVTQLLYSLAMQSGLESHVKSPKNKEEHQKEEDSLEMAQAMQQQMLFLMPLMTVVISTRFPAGLALYWVVTTVFSFVQQLIISGPGGLPKYKNLALSWVQKLTK